MQSEPDSQCVQEIVDAIGKCGSREHLQKLVEMAPTFFRGDQSPVALSVARFAIRRIKDSLATEYAAGLVGNSGSTKMAVYAMMRIGDSLSAKRHLPALVSAMNHNSPEIRMWTAAVLGLVSDSIARVAVMSHALDDTDWSPRQLCPITAESES